MGSSGMMRAVLLALVGVQALLQVAESYPMMEEEQAITGDVELNDSDPFSTPYHLSQAEFQAQAADMTDVSAPKLGEAASERVYADLQESQLNKYAMAAADTKNKGFVEYQPKRPGIKRVEDDIAQMKKNGMKPLHQKKKEDVQIDPWAPQPDSLIQMDMGPGVGEGPSRAELLEDTQTAPAELLEETESIPVVQLGGDDVGESDDLGESNQSPIMSHMQNERDQKGMYKLFGNRVKPPEYKSKPKRLYKHKKAVSAFDKLANDEELGEESDPLKQQSEEREVDEDSKLDTSMDKFHHAGQQQHMGVYSYDPNSYGMYDDPLSMTRDELEGQSGVSNGGSPDWRT